MCGHCFTVCYVCFDVCCNPAFLAAKSNKAYYYNNKLVITSDDNVMQRVVNVTELSYPITRVYVT